MEKKQWGEPSSKNLNYFKKHTVELDGCLIWRGEIVKSGYGRMWCYGRRWPVSRLVLIWADGGEERINRQAIHTCRNRHCCALDHLTWGTPKQNAADKIRDNTQTHGSVVPNSKLKEHDIEDILKRYHEQGQSGPAIARIYGVSSVNIRRIIRGTIWRRVSQQVKLTKRRPVSARGRQIRTRALDNAEVLRIWDMWHRQAMSMAVISEKTGVKAHVVRGLLSRKLYADVTDGLAEPRARRINRGLNKLMGASLPMSRRLATKEVIGIWHLRHDKQIQQCQVALQYNVTVNTVRRVERGLSGQKHTSKLACARGSACVICSKYKLDLL